MFDVAERVERFIVFVPMTTPVVLCMEQQFCLPTVRDVLFFVFHCPLLSLRFGYFLLAAIEHFSNWSNRKSRRSCGGEIESRTVKKHARVGDTVGTKRAIRQSPLTKVRSEKLIGIVIVSRHALTASFEFSAYVEPAAQAVQNDNLVPKSSLGIDDSDVTDSQIDIRHILLEIGADAAQRIGIKRRFCTGLDFHGLPNPLNSASRVQQTQKSFSTFCGVVPKRCAVVVKRPRRVSSSAEIILSNAGFTQHLLALPVSGAIDSASNSAMSSARPRDRREGACRSQDH